MSNALIDICLGNVEPAIKVDGVGKTKDELCKCIIIAIHEYFEQNSTTGTVLDPTVVKRLKARLLKELCDILDTRDPSPVDNQSGIIGRIPDDNTENRFSISVWVSGKKWRVCVVINF